MNGNFTFYGGALLANDPHLDSGMPSAWYPCELIYADADVLGGTLPGIPSVLIGRNQNIGWSTTVLYSDTTDLYSEKLLPNN